MMSSLLPTKIYSDERRLAQELARLTVATILPQE
jgi:P2-related tail formation protein